MSGPDGSVQKINFLNDEFGSKIRRWAADDDDDDDSDDERNVKFEAFFFLYQAIAFSVFWPAKEIEEDDEIVRWCDKDDDDEDENDDQTTDKCNATMRNDDKDVPQWYHIRVTTTTTITSLVQLLMTTLPVANYGWYCCDKSKWQFIKNEISEQ